jgi:hypothetical protein
MSSRPAGEILTSARSLPLVEMTGKVLRENNIFLPRYDKLIVSLDIKMILETDLGTCEDQPGVGIGNHITDGLMLVLQVNKDLT